MLRRTAWLLAIALILPGLVRAGGEDSPAPSRPSVSAPKASGRHFPFTKEPRNDTVILGEHEHELEGLFYPPQSHHYTDLDTAPNDMLNRNVRILRTTNKAQLNRYVPIVYNFKNVNPFAVLRFMRRPIQMEEGALFTFMNPNGTSGKALIAIPEYQVEYMLKLMETIDRPNLTTGDGSKRIYRQLKHRRANIDDSSSILDDTAFIEQFGVYLTFNDHLVIVDPEQNAVFIEDAPSGSDWLDAAITSKLDFPTPQALLNTKVYELKVSNNSRIGLDFIAWKNGPGADLLALGGFAERGRVSLRSGGSSTMSDTNGLGALSLPRSDFESNGYNFAYRYEIHSAFLDYLATKGKAKVLTSAKIAALNTRPAAISATDQILYYAVQTTDPSGVRPRGDAFAANDGRTVVGTTSELVTEDGESDPSLSSVAVGLEISLTPLIYENGLDLAIDGSLSSYNGYDDSGFPVINSREISTKVRMKEGEEMILGGLTRTTEAKATNKVPVLGSIPVLGYLFGGDSTNKSKNEVVIAIQAEKIDRFSAKGGGVSAAEQEIIKQGEGTDNIAPATTFGFDQFGLDSDK